MDKEAVDLHTHTKNTLSAAINAVREHTKEQYFIGICDSITFSIVQQLFNTVQLSDLGINLIFSLEEERKNRNYAALYIIAPIDESVKLIIDDFVLEPKYSAVHILSLNTMEDGLVKRIKKSDLKKHLKSLQQINLQYSPWLQNNFSFNMLDYFQKDQKWTQATASRLASLLINIQAKGNIEFYYQSKSQKLVAETTKAITMKRDKLKHYKVQRQGGNSKVRVLIYERINDLQTPLMRSYNYLPMLYETQNVVNDQIKISDKQIFTINNSDVILSKSKYATIEEAADHIYKESIDIRNYSNSKEVNKKLLEVSKSQKSVIHHQSFLKLIQLRGQSFVALTTLEQTIVNGIDPTAKKHSDSSLYRELTKHFKDGVNINEAEYAKTFSICYLSIDLDKEEKQNLMEPLLDTKFKNLQKNLDRITQGEGYPKKLSEKPQKQQRLDLFRHQPRLVTLLENNEVDRLPGYATTTVEQTQQSLKRQKIQISKFSKTSKLIIFFTGYVGINEIIELNRTKLSNEEQILIIGSNRIVSSKEYIQQLAK